jgi:hypothetical protein
MAFFVTHKGIQYLVERSRPAGSQPGRGQDRWSVSRGRELITSLPYKEGESWSAVQERVIAALEILEESSGR